MMELAWIKVTPEVENGIEIINGLDMSKFQKFLIHIKTYSSLRSKSEIFTPEEVTALERVFKLNPDEVSIVIKISVYLLERMSKFVMNPKSLLNDLINSLHMEKEKALAFINVWQSLLKYLIEDFGISDFGVKDQLIHTEFDVNLAVCSQLNKKEKLTSVFLQVYTVNDKETVNNIPTLEFTKEELSNFSNQLDNIQHELDTVLSLHA